MAFKFSSDYFEWRQRYNTELRYTQRQLDEAVKAAIKSRTVNRVVKSLDGEHYGPGVSMAMQILAVHETPEGVLVIVK